MKVAHRVLLAFAMSMSIGPAASQCVVLLPALTGPGSAPQAMTGTDLGERWVSKFPLDLSRGKRGEVRVIDSQANPPVAMQAVHKARAVDGCFSVLTERWTASLLNGSNFLVARGQRNPFSNIGDDFKQLLPGREKLVAYVTVGWIPFNYPGLDVKREGDTYVIKLKEGDLGWPEYAFGVLADTSLDSRTTNDVMDWVTTAQASEIFGKWFYVVPDNTALKRRVRIDLVKKDGTVITSTRCDSGNCYPRLADGRVTYKDKAGEEHTICGVRSACPQFMPKPDFQLVPAERKLRP